MFLIVILIFLCFVGLFALLIIIDSQCDDKNRQKSTKLVLSKYRSKIDQERKSISKILHDSVNQKIIFSKILLENLYDEFKDDKIKQLIKLNGEIYSECRNVINYVRIEVLESLGLIDAIYELIETYKKLPGNVEFNFNHENINKFSKTISSNIYYIVSEALLNVIKHANANKVNISLIALKNNKFKLEIKDDGVGFSVINYGVGLTDIEERANDIDAKISILSSLNNGVEINLTFLSE